MPLVQPSRVQGQPFGVQNANQGNVASQAQGSPNLFSPFNGPVIATVGPTQPIEQFNRPGIPLEVSRALNQLQQNVAQSISQIKNNPKSYQKLFEGLQLAAGALTSGAPVGPFCIIQHGLGKAYRGYTIGTVRGGFITAHAAIAPSPQYPAAQWLVLWTQQTAFVLGGVTQSVLADIEVYG
jgi:hypothetical protein